MADYATVVLVHGEFQGPDCWTKVTTGLQNTPIPFVVVDLRSAEETASHASVLNNRDFHRRHVEDALANLDDETKVVLVGHGQSGQVVTDVAKSCPSRVQHVVYIAAVVPGIELTAREGETCPNPYTTTFRNELRDQGDGTFDFDADRVASLLCSNSHDHDIVNAVVAGMEPNQKWQAPKSESEKWEPSTPASYIVCRDDQVLDPEYQAFASARFSNDAWPHRVNWFDLDTGHCALFTNHGELALYLAVVAINHFVLPNTTAELRDDKDVVKIALKYCAFEVFFASARLKGDPDTAKTAVEAWPDVIGFLPIHRDNPGIVMKALESKGALLQYASKRLRDEADVVFLAVKNDPEAFQFASTRLKNDTRFVVMLVEERAYKALKYVSDALMDDEAAVLEIVKKNGRLLDYASQRMKDHADIMMEVIRQDGLALRFASDRLKDDETFVLEALKMNGWALRFASDRLKDDADLVMEAVKEAGNALRYASERLRDDVGIALEATKKETNAFEYASERLKDNAEFVQAAVKQDAAALRFASERLQDDTGIVLYAVKEDPFLLEFASERLQGDNNIAMVAVKKEIEAIEFVSLSLRDNPDFMLEAIKLDTLAVEFASAMIRDDAGIILEAVKKDGLCLEFASDRLKDSHAIVLAAVRKDGSALRYASQRLRDDDDLVREAVEEDAYALHHSSERLRDDADIVLEAVKKSGRTLSFASERLRDDAGIVLEAVIQTGFALKFASERLRDDAGIVMEAVRPDYESTRVPYVEVRFNGGAGPGLKYASPRLQDDHEIVLASMQTRLATGEFASERLKNDVLFLAQGIARSSRDIDLSDYFTKRFIKGVFGPMFPAFQVLLQIRRMINGIVCFPDDGGRNARTYCDLYKGHHAERMWLLGQVCEPLPFSLVKLIDEFSDKDISRHFLLANKLVHFLPIYAALEGKGIGWLDFVNDDDFFKLIHST